MKNRNFCGISLKTVNGLSGGISNMKLKPIDELTFTDDYMFKEVLTRNLHIAKKIVEFALKRKVKDIRLAGTEVEKQGSYLTKKTRYDVLLEGEDAWIVIEMHHRKENRLSITHSHLSCSSR